MALMVAQQYKIKINLKYICYETLLMLFVVLLMVATVKRV